MHDVPSPAIKDHGLRDRKYDLVVARLGSDVRKSEITDDLHLEYLFDDPLTIAVGLHSRWAQRRAIDLAELIEEPWLLNRPNAWAHICVAEAFHSRGIEMPKVSLFGFSVHLVNHFVANGPFVTAMARSVTRFRPLKVLPVKLPVRPWPVVIATLKIAP